MSIRYERKFTPGMLKKNPEDVYVFGDSLDKTMKSGNAVVRAEPNAFGIPVRRDSSRSAGSLFSDKEDELDAVVKALRELYQIAKTKTLVFPLEGIGEGSSRLSERSPMISEKLSTILNDHFKVSFENVSHKTPEV